MNQRLARRSAATRAGARSGIAGSFQLSVACIAHRKNYFDSPFDRVMHKWGGRLEKIHGDDDTPNRLGGTAPGTTFERTGERPMIASDTRGVAPGTYHRAISIGWWLAALVVGGVVWATLLL